MGCREINDHDETCFCYVGVFDKAVELIEEEGFNEDLILNTSVEKIMKFLNLKVK